MSQQHPSRLARWFWAAGDILLATTRAWADAWAQAVDRAPQAAGGAGRAQADLVHALRRLALATCLVQRAAHRCRHLADDDGAHHPPETEGGWRPWPTTTAAVPNEPVDRAN